MRINEVQIARYGPLHDFGPFSFGNFTLIFGDNESGKTMLLDAIIRLLLRKSKEQGLFHQLDRVEHNPKGYIEIIKRKETFRLPDDGNLADLLEIHPQDLRNVFIVRVSDLELPEESNYFSKITDRLAGIHREPILQIRKQLKQIGCLTNDNSGAKLSDGAEFGKLASKVENARSLLPRIDDFLKSCEDNQILALETEQLELHERIETLKQELDRLEAAEKRDKYQSGRAALNELAKISSELASQPDIGDKEVEQWHDADRTSDEAQSTLGEKGILLEQQTISMDSLETKLREVELSLEKETHRKEGVRHLQEEIDAQKHRIVKSGERKPLRAMMGNLSIGLFGVLLILIAGMIFIKNIGLFGILAIAMELAFLLAVAWLIVDRMRLGEIEGSWERLRLEATRQDFCGDSLETLIEALGDFDRNLHAIEGQHHLVDKDLHIIKTKVENTQADIERLKQTIDKSRDFVRQLQSRSKLASIIDLRNALDRKKQLERERDKLFIVLSEKFGKVKGTIEEQQAVWQSCVADLSAFSESALDIENDKAREELVKKESRELEGRVEENRGRLLKIREAIRKIASDANGILSTEDPLPGDTVQDVEVIRDRISRFILEVEERTRLALKAISILETIEEEESQKVRELFGHNDKASKFLKEITAGGYTQAEYDLTEEELVVQRPNGEKFRASQLSSGTYDQLYLATRLSLASRILQDENGFFLLDDPFLTSDKKRLGRQFDILRKIVKEGWQIIYFSVKEEVLRELRSDITRGDVKLLRMKPLLSE